MCDAEDIGEGLQYKHCGCAHIGDSWIVIERQRRGGGAGAHSWHASLIFRSCACADYDNMKCSCCCVGVLLHV